MDENFHKDHLACKNCDKQLIACRYIVKEEHPYCIPCYQQLFAHNCDECGKPIGPDFKDLSYKERHWHEFCFKCCGCQASLVDQPFASKNEKIYCSDCHDNNFAARCDDCGEPFRGEFHIIKLQLMSFTDVLQSGSHRDLGVQGQRTPNIPPAESDGRSSGSYHQKAVTLETTLGSYYSVISLTFQSGHGRGDKTLLLAFFYALHKDKGVKTLVGSER
ncbi:four and a half LIM domains protein 2 [Plakobranchus ocellatus]|uniref:Four and a half LIM domains protein 2 n=1 Tax=Plakobranchus ocellatus TaxID=259542 RepID=A0AAV3YLI7_9GAST|nr:four and a half LIM domains protein 2 [Plakobranchus ocellatus]